MHKFWSANMSRSRAWVRYKVHSSCSFIVLGKFSKRLSTLTEPAIMDPLKQERTIKTQPVNNGCSNWDVGFCDCRPIMNNTPGWFASERTTNGLVHTNCQLMNHLLPIKSSLFVHLMLIFFSKPKSYFLNIDYIGMV